MLFPADKLAGLIEDHLDFLIKTYGEKELVDFMHELGIPVSPWKRVVNLKKQGCKLLGEPGLWRWTWFELLVVLCTAVTCATNGQHQEGQQS